MKNERGFTSVELVIAIVFLLGVGGWVANIVKLVGMGFADISGMLIARSIGIVIAPLGAVLGFL